MRVRVLPGVPNLFLRYAMKYFNCFVKYAIREEHTMFIQMSERCMNSPCIDDINSAIRKKIADRHYGDGESAKILEVNILGQFEI